MSTGSLSSVWFRLQEHLLTVQTLAADIEKQEVVAGEIRSCVNIPDAKRIWQRLAALQIRRSETEDRFNALIQLLEERQDWPQVFQTRYNRYISWAGSMEQRLLHKQRALLDDVLQRLSGPLRDELAAKENERRWLVSQGRELSHSCDSQERREELLAQVTNVEETWRKLMETWNQELQRLQQLPADLDGLNSSLAELTTWFSQVEATLSAPLVVAACNPGAVESRLAEHRDLEECIEEKRPIVASVLSLCESFTTNYALLHGWLGTDLDAVECAMQALQRRWKAISHASAERSASLESLWPDWSAVLDVHDQLDEILTRIEESVPGDGEATSEQVVGRLESLVHQLHAPETRQKLNRLNELFCILARDGRLDAAGELQQKVARVNAQWRGLSDRLSALLQSARGASSLSHHWEVSHLLVFCSCLSFIHLRLTFSQGLKNRMMVWCSHCELQLQQIESNVLPEDATPSSVLNSLKEELEGLEKVRAEIRELGRTLVQQGVPEMQAQLDDYLRTEDEVLLKLAQMQVRQAQKEQDRLSLPTSPMVETASISDSGVFSYTDREASQKSAEPADSQSIPLARPVSRRSEESSSDRDQSSPVARPVPPPPPPGPPRSSPEATGAKSRSYADVTKTPPKSGSPVRSQPTPPPVSVKSDTQRQLELALHEWRQRLVRLDHLMKTSNLDEAPVDAANDIVRSLLFFFCFSCSILQ